MRPFALASRPRVVTLLAAALGLAAVGWGRLAAAAPPAVGDRAADFELPRLGGGKARLSEVAKGGPAVLVVLRGYPGYQCPLCTRQFAEFVGRADDFRAAGARVVFVYPGPGAGLADRAGEFAGGKGLPAGFHFLLDPDYTFTNAYGLRWDARNETAYPATFVLDGDRKVTFAKVSTSHAGRAGAAEALKALGGK